MRNSSKFSLGIALIVLIAVVGCSTLPRPSDDAEGVLVIAVEHNNETGSEYFGHYKLAVKDEQERYAFQTLTADRSRVTVLVPGGGPYTLETEFWYSSDVRAGTFHQVSSPRVKAGQIVINPYYIEVSFVDNEDGTTTMRRDWYPLTIEKRAEIIRQIEADRNFQYWTLQE